MPISLAKLFETENDHWSALEDTGYWGRQAAGCIILAKDTGRVLISQRGRVEEPGTWGTWGGAIDLDESPEEAVRRELKEEAGYTERVALVPLYVYKDKSFRYYNFLAVVDHEFVPNLTWEVENYQWVDFDNIASWPRPWHFGLKDLMRHSYKKIKKYVDASDAKKGMVTEDKNGKIQVTPIGMVEDGVFEYEITSPYSWLTFRKDRTRKVFVFDSIGTDEKYRNKGYATLVLNEFFKIVANHGRWPVEVEAYSSAGEIYIKPLVARFAAAYKVRLLK